MSAGSELRQRMDDALERASKDAGRSLEWSEREQVTLEKAEQTADHAEALRARLVAALANPDSTDAGVVKLSAELRLLDRQVVDLLARLSVGLEPAKSERHQRASRARWERAASWPG